MVTAARKEAQRRENELKAKRLARRLVEASEFAAILNRWRHTGGAPC